MQITLERQDSLGKKDSINIDYKIAGTALIFDLPYDKEFFYKIFVNDKEYTLSFSGNIKLNFLPAGENFISIKAYSGNNLIWKTDKFRAVVDSIEPVYEICENKVHLFWNPVQNAEGYTLYSKTGENVFTSIKDTSINEVNLYGFTDGAELKIKPFRTENGTKVFDLPVVKFVLNKACSFQDLRLSAVVKKSCVNLNWTKIAGADEYRIYSLKGEEFVQAGQTNSCFWKAEYLSVGVTYFCVKAFKNNGCIAESPVAACNISGLEMFALNNNYKITLYWNKVEGYDGYRVFKKNEKGEFAGFLSVKEEKAVIENIVPGEVCEFKVKPYIMENGQRTFKDLSAKCKIAAYTTDKIDLYVNEAYGGELSLSWIFDGEVDGFFVYKDDAEYLDIKDGLAHIAMVKYSESGYQIKGYKNVFGERIFTCESDKVSVKSDKNRLHQTCPAGYKVSVVIPTYNAQKFISRCISTVLGCDLDDVEVVVVDDGSKDNAREILSWYAEKYPYFVRTVFKENGGAADARNFGIKEVRGKYTAFIDSDDMIRPTAYSTMFNTLESTGSDIAVAQLYKIDNERYFSRHILPLESYKALNPEDYMRLIFTEKFNNVAVWNKMYKSELVKSHPIPLLSYEDVSWTPYILSWADKICYIDKEGCEWDRKIRSVTLSNELSNRAAELKFEERLQAVKFFRDNGNPKRREILTYLMAKRLYNQGVTAKFPGYFDAIIDIKDELVNNKFLHEDEEYYRKISPLLK